MLDKGDIALTGDGEGKDEPYPSLQLENTPNTEEEANGEHAASDACNGLVWLIQIMAERHRMSLERSTVNARYTGANNDL